MSRVFVKYEIEKKKYNPTMVNTHSAEVWRCQNCDNILALANRDGEIKAQIKCKRCSTINEK